MYEELLRLDPNLKHEWQPYNGGVERLHNLPEAELRALLEHVLSMGGKAIAGENKVSGWEATKNAALNNSVVYGIGESFTGFSVQFSYNNLNVPGADLEHLKAKPWDSTPRMLGRIAADTFNLCQGAAEIVGGGAVGLGGGTLCVASLGGTCVVTAPAAVMGATVATHGTVVAGNSLTQFGEHVYMMSEGGQGESSETRGSQSGIIDNSSPEQYAVSDASNGNFYAVGEVENNGELVIYMRTKDREAGLASTVLRGEEQFRAIVQHLAGRFNRIAGSWSYGDNLARVNRLTASGMSLEEAAAQTWTGEQSRLAGYTRVTVINYEGSPGNYTRVYVNFHQP